MRNFSSNNRGVFYYACIALEKFLQHSTTDVLAPYAAAIVDALLACLRQQDELSEAVYPFKALYRVLQSMKNAAQYNAQLCDIISKMSYMNTSVVHYAFECVAVCIVASPSDASCYISFFESVLRDNIVELQPHGKPLFLG